MKKATEDLVELMLQRAHAHLRVDEELKTLREYVEALERSHDERGGEGQASTMTPECPICGGLVTGPIRRWTTLRGRVWRTERSCCFDCGEEWYTLAQSRADSHRYRCALDIRWLATLVGVILALLLFGCAYVAGPLTIAAPNVAKKLLPPPGNTDTANWVVCDSPPDPSLHGPWMFDTRDDAETFIADRNLKGWGCRR